MSEENNCCGHGRSNMGDMSEWKEKYAKMSNDEKKEMLEKKKDHLNDKMAWVKEELSKLE